MTEHMDRDSRQDQILEAAMKIFIERGYENTTVDEIAKEAGLSKGSVYWYFKSKLDILFELADRCVSEGQMHVVSSAEKLQGPEVLYKVHRELYDEHLNNPSKNLILNQLGIMAARQPEIRDRLRKYHNAWDDVAAGLVQRAVDSGKFKPVNALHIGQAVTSLWDGLMTRAQYDPTIDIVGVVETTTRLLYEALVIRTENKTDSENLA